jgi:hypothetical protein
MYLVTKVYSEVFTEYAVLRLVEAGMAGQTIRLKIVKTPEGVLLPGYTFTQDAQEF